MAITIIQQPKSLSGSENPNNIILSSDNSESLGFRFKIEYFDKDNKLLFKPVYLVADISGKLMFDLHKLMKSYVKLTTKITLDNFIIPTDQTFEYKVKITEQYLVQYDMKEYYYMQPYAGQNKTVIETYQDHNFIVGDIIRIENPVVTSVSSSSSEENIINALDGVHTVTDIVDNKNFVIDTPFMGSSLLVSGQVYFNSNKMTTDEDITISDLFITYSYSTQKQLQYPTSSMYQNNLMGYYTSIVPLFNYFDNINIYDWQYYYLNFVDLNEARFKSIMFYDDDNTDTININDNYKNILININPNLNSTITNTYTNYTFDLIDMNNDIVYTKKIKIKSDCVRYKSQIMFYDHKGSFVSLPMTRRLNKNTNINRDGHVINSNFANNNFLNTENNFETIITIGEDWLSAADYEHLEDLFTSPYVYYLEENDKLPIQVEIVDKSLSRMDYKSTNRYKIELKIKIIK